MLCMLGAVKLQPSVSRQTFEDSLSELSRYLEREGLISSSSSVGERYRHPIMDTDEADLDLLFTLSFETREQLEASIKLMTERVGLGTGLHENLWSQLNDYRFTCWEE